MTSVFDNPPTDDRHLFLEDSSRKNFKWPYLSNRSYNMIHSRFGSRVGSASLTVSFIFTSNLPLLPWQRNLGQNGL